MPTQAAAAAQQTPTGAAAGSLYSTHLHRTCRVHRRPQCWSASEYAGYPARLSLSMLGNVTRPSHTTGRRNPRWGRALPAVESGAFWTGAGVCAVRRRRARTRRNNKAGAESCALRPGGGLDSASSAPLVPQPNFRRRPAVHSAPASPAWAGQRRRSQSWAAEPRPLTPSPLSTARVPPPSLTSRHRPCAPPLTASRSLTPSAQSACRSSPPQPGVSKQLPPSLRVYLLTHPPPPLPPPPRFPSVDFLPPLSSVASHPFPSPASPLLLPPLFTRLAGCVAATSPSGGCWGCSASASSSTSPPSSVRPSRRTW